MSLNNKNYFHFIFIQCLSHQNYLNKDLTANDVFFQFDVVILLKITLGYSEKLRVKIMVEKQNKFSRRAIALFWLLAVSLVIGILIYFEQLAVLYVLATVSVVALLVTVAFADLEKVGTEGIGNFGGREDGL